MDSIFAPNQPVANPDPFGDMAEVESVVLSDAEGGEATPNKGDKSPAGQKSGANNNGLARMTKPIPLRNAGVTTFAQQDLKK